MPLILSLLLFPAVLAHAALTSPVVARVNGEPILRAELEREMAKQETVGGRDGAESRALESLIRFHLGAQEAKSQKLDAEPQVKRQVNEVLYRTFVESRLSNARVTLAPSDRELEAHYEEAPLVRLRHLVLLAPDESTRDEAKKTAALIRKRLDQGVTFKKLVLQYSQDESVKTAGDLDFRGVHQLPPELYRVAIGLKNGAVAPQIFHEGALHFIQLIDRKPFAAAPAPYREMLRSRLRAEREERFLSTIFDSLRKDAKIEIANRTRVP